MSLAPEGLFDAVDDFEARRPARFGIDARDALPVIMGLAAVLAGVSGQQPTGNAGADFLWSAGFGLAFVWLAQRSSAQSVVVSALLALFFTGFQLPWLLVGLAALASALMITLLMRLDRPSWLIAVSVTAALIVQVVLNLPSFRFAGSASLMAAVSVAPVVLSGARAVVPKYRRWLFFGIAGFVLFAVVAGAAAAYAGISVRRSVEAGIEQAQDGVSALEAGDEEQAEALLSAAQENFSNAEGRLSGPLTWPARIVPIVAQHSRALETAASQGAALGRTALRTVSVADVEEIRGVNGAIDLELVQRVDAELTNANAVLVDAQSSIARVRTPWLIPPLDAALADVQAEMMVAGDSIDLANQATSVIPDLLGASGKRRYLVLFVQPAEAREFGGLVGAYGILEADDGRLSLSESGSLKDLEGTDAVLGDPDTFTASYLRTQPARFPQNLTAVPNLTTIRRAAVDLWPQLWNDPSNTIDGVITLDPYALAGLLELSGPVRVASLDEPIDASNVVNYLLRGQYLAFDADSGSGNEVRQDALTDLAAAAFDALLNVELPGPERLGQVFGPVARADRLGISTINEDENDLFARVFLSSDIPQVGSAVEMLAVYSNQVRASKLDAYISRRLEYTVDVNPATGQVVGNGVILLENSVPADAPAYVTGLDDRPELADEPAVGAAVNVISIYTRSELTNLGAGAFPLGEVTPGFGYERHAAQMAIPAGSTVSVPFSTQLLVQPGRYDLLLHAQPAASNTDYTLTIRPAAGWRVVHPQAAADGSLTLSDELVASMGFTFFFESVT